MNEAVLIYPHQLYPTTWAGFAKNRPVFLIEESLFLTEFKIHNQKLLLHRLSLKAYQKELTEAGYTVHYIDVLTHPQTEDIFKKLDELNIDTVHIADTTDDWLERRIKAGTAKYHQKRVLYPSLLFILQNDYKERYVRSHKHLANFYKSLRVDLNLLIDKDNEPLGGQFSFDQDNRSKLPKSQPFPADIHYYKNEDIEDALGWLETIPGEHYGQKQVWLPYDREGAWAFFQKFLNERFDNFGKYEDAIITEHHRLFHSAISPLLNIGLLDPSEVIKEAIAYGQKNQVPLNSIEGFLRQILGWREFIRAAYEVDGRKMRTRNYFNHSAQLPDFMWTGLCDLVPIKDAVSKALQTGYNHHIERLMVLGNFLLLSETDPDEVYSWFMTMYVDAYDWVMVPNVYGMSQFADGGIFATKPYISGGNYLKKMSDYPKGDWEDIYTSLYWNFINKHRALFLKNHRLSMMPRLFDKMPEAVKKAHLDKAEWFLKNLAKQS